MTTISSSTTTTTAYKVTGDTTGTLVLQTGAGPTTAMTIDGSQNVGIGTTTVIAGVKCNTQGWVASSNSNTDRLVVGQDVRGTSTVFGLPTGSSWVCSVGNSVANALGVGTYGADPLVFATNNAERMRVDGSGNVGIGVTPNTWQSGRVALQVSGSTANYIGGASSNSTVFNSNYYVDASGNEKFIAASGYAHLYYQNASTGSHAWYVSTAASGGVGSAATMSQKMTLDSSGNLLVGTTSAINASAKVNVYNTSGGSGGLAIGYGSGAAANRIIYLVSSNGGLYFESSANAAYLNSAGAWTNASDARLKNSITDIKYGLSAVLNTQPRSYKMNDLEGDYIGFVAQELQAVIPEVVSGDPEKQLGVDYGSLVAVAFKAIQEQQALIQTLTERITALENK